MKLPQILALLSLALLTHAEAQTNLVPNPSFEAFDSCQDVSFFPISSDGYLPPWFQPTAGTADYYTNFCGQSLYNSWPFNLGGFQYPHTGIAYTGVYMFANTYDSVRNYKEYMACPLLAPLEKGKTYEVSFWVSTSINTLVPPQYGYAANGIGAYFSKEVKSLFLSGFQESLPFIPQFDSDTMILDMTNWARLCGRFTAEGGEKYLTIGNFHDDAHTSKVLLNVNSNYLIKESAYCYIDDVSVVETNAQRLLPADTVLCASAFPFTIVAGQPSHNHHWSTGETTPSITVSQPGTYFLNARNGLCQLIDTIHISLKAAPKTAFRDTVVCANALPLTLQAPTGLDNWTWPGGSATPDYAAQTTGWQILQGNWYCGAFADSMFLTIEDPLALNLGGDTTLCVDGEEVPKTLGNAAQLANYQWSTGETTPEITVSQPGSYALTSENACGSDTDSIRVFGCIPRIYIPNVFSPNGDGVNDFFTAYGQNILIERLQIFDRYGILLYDEQNPQKGWDGTAGRQACQNGVYIFTLSYLTLDKFKQKISRTGSVTLAR